MLEEKHEALAKRVEQIAKDIFEQIQKKIAELQVLLDRVVVRVDEAEQRVTRYVKYLASLGVCLSLLREALGVVSVLCGLCSDCMQDSCLSRDGADIVTFFWFVRDCKQDCNKIVTTLCGFCPNSFADMSVLSIYLKCPSPHIF